jgi:hypothetical protein
MSRHKHRHPPPGGQKYQTFDEALAAAERAGGPGKEVGLGFVVTDAIRAEVSDDVLRQMIAAGVTLFDALGRELYFNARGKLIPVQPDFTPGIGDK